MTQVRPLTPKQKQFVVEYLKDCDGAKAAVRAGYSENGASAQASRLLADVKVKAFLERKLNRVLDRMEFTADKVLDGLARIAFSDIRDLYDEDGNLLEPYMLPSSIALAVQAFKKDGAKLEYKLAPKEKGLEGLGRYFALFKDKLEIAIDPQRLAELAPDKLAEVEALAKAAASQLEQLKKG